MKGRKKENTKEGFAEAKVEKKIYEEKFTDSRGRRKGGDAMDKKTTALIRSLVQERAYWLSSRGPTSGAKKKRRIVFHEKPKGGKKGHLQDK